jgi:peptidoglycan/LPS O-acetylase OafA/YrhL
VDDETNTEGWLLKPFAKKHGRFILASVAGVYLISLAVCIYLACKSSMNWIVLIGAFWLGALVGMLLGFYVQEAKIWDHRALAASIGAIAGISIIYLLQVLSLDKAVPEIWSYPMGLVGGFMIGTIWEHAEPSKSK